MTQEPSPSSLPWLGELKPFEKPSWGAVFVQLLNTLLPFAALAVLGGFLHLNQAPWYAFAALDIVMALFLVRIFIFFHDCTHGSYTPSPRVNGLLGYFFGILTFTPYKSWRRSHGIHHATTGQLDHRGVGDVWTMTLKEYEEASPGRRLWYRIYRNPLFLFFLIPSILFLVLHRIPSKEQRKDEVLSVMANNLGLLLAFTALWLTGFGGLIFSMILPTMAISATLGVWLFYVQHQFDPAYWARDKHWDLNLACLQGSSHYKLGAFLQWFTGNIGFHHIHHLKPRIPNYMLPKCYKAVKELQLPDPLTIRKSFSSLFLHIWDEARGRLIGFKELRSLLKA